MLVNSRGIVLSTLRYSDSSMIVRMLTEHAGQKAFLVRVGKGRSALGKVALLQPLSLVNVAFDHDDRHGLRTPRSLERGEPLLNIPFDTVKSTIAIFMAEVIARTQPEETADTNLFRFLWDAVLKLDAEERPCTNFHLAFLLQLTHYLGCGPHVENARTLPYFDLKEGTCCNVPPLHPHYVDGETKEVLLTLAEKGLRGHSTVTLSNDGRRNLLRAMVDYYRLHVHGMQELRSHLVLEEVMA